MTLFPEQFEAALGSSILKRAVDSGLIKVELINIRDYTDDKHGRVDDYTYGGGAGMLMRPQPVYDCYKAIIEKYGLENPRTIYLTPQGSLLKQAKCVELSKEEDIILLCGHYEGIDERVLELIVTDYLSIGDYVLTGGELAAMTVIDSVSRLVPGVLGNSESSETESFDGGLLEYPQYTRPETFMDKKVPEVLLSGHHKNVEKWRREQSIKRTLERRPDLLALAELTDKERKALEDVKEQ